MMTEDDQARLRTAERIAAVRSRFLAGLAERTKTLAELALAAAGPDPASAAAAGDGLRLGLHNLAGAAPTLGLVALGRRAASLEKRVIAERSEDGRLSAPVAAEIARDVKALTDTAV
jgi:HPt (histidine-containing phosphotransfer) domain-containing protein